MTWRDWLGRRRKGGAAGPGGPGGPAPENTEAYPELEGRLDPNTAALMDGAPPAGVGGRTQPEPDPRRSSPPRGPTERDTRHLPG